MTVLLATFAGMPEGEPGFEALNEALTARGIDFAWAVWDDPSVDWAAASLVAIRATWDYAVRADEFLAWTRSLDQSRLLNGADVFEWNHDKAYLTDLDPIPVVPTRLAATPRRVRPRDRRVRHLRHQAPRQRGRCRADHRDRPPRQPARPDAAQPPDVPARRRTLDRAAARGVGAHAR